MDLNRGRQNPIIETDFRHNRLKVPKLGEIKIYMHRPIEGDPKEVTIVKKASGWYAHISCEIPDTPKVEPTAAVAVDVGTTDYLTTSEGEKEENPRWYRQAEGLLRKHSKDLSRKKKGSNRRKKQQHKLAMHHERTTNKRKDFIGKLVYKLYHHQENTVLVAEDLSVSNMVRNKHLSKSISDASWATFFKWCADIAERDGLHFHQVNPKDTSQTCSCCGIKSPKKLSLAIRTFDCSFVAHLLTETTTLHSIYSLGLLRPFVESGGLPPSVKRETIRMKRLALKTSISSLCLTVSHSSSRFSAG